MNKKQANYYLRRIYGLLLHGENPVIFTKKLTNNKIGLTDHEYIWIDPSQEILATFIHEALHILYPKWKHPKVYRKEKAICKNLSSKQYTNLFHRLEEAMKFQLNDNDVPPPEGP